jgi:hypothetical protein
MSRSRNRRKPVTNEPTVFDMARDEMFQHIIRCEVIGADPEHQTEWFNDTMVHMSERWHELTPKQISDLRILGERFAKPARSSAPAAVESAMASTDEVESETETAVESEAESLDTVSA